MLLMLMRSGSCQAEPKAEIFWSLGGLKAETERREKSPVGKGVDPMTHLLTLL